MAAISRESAVLDAWTEEQQTVADLETGEKVVLWSMRMRLEGAGALEHIREGFRLGREGVTGEAAFGAFEPWYLLLATHCRRDIRLHRPKCPCLSDDEREVLSLIAHVQDGNQEAARRFATSLVYEHALISFLAASLTFGQALAHLDLRLPRRCDTGPRRHRLH